MTIPQLGDPRPARQTGSSASSSVTPTSASLSSLAQIAEALDVRLGHLVDWTRSARASRFSTSEDRINVLLSSREEMRFHVTESHIEP